MNRPQLAGIDWMSHGTPCPLAVAATECPLGLSTLDAIVPDMRDLVVRLRFAPEEGEIRLDAERVAIMHLSTFAALRRELIDRLGVPQARGLFMSMGYASGMRDAGMARATHAGDTVRNAFVVGLQLRRLQGFAAAKVERLEIDVAGGCFEAEFAASGSCEVEAHLTVYGSAAAPACWMLVGYASGYASAFLGRAVLFKETECRATGAVECRIVGKLVGQWNDEEDLPALQPAAVAGQMLAQRSWPAFDTRATPLSEEMVGQSPEFVAACRLLQRVAGTEATVLLQGETGVGKEMFARALHRMSKRAPGPFVAVNCAAIPENLIEAELFGVEKGAFTGAAYSRPGRFERADTGTLFLDEVSSLPLAAQAKLLRAIQEREIERVGDVKARKVDVRIVAATSVNLANAVSAALFRDDLYFRLSVFPLHIPPLRARREDIPLLVQRFAGRYARLYGREIGGLTAGALERLLNYDYPGNIRELQNMVERAVILCDNGRPLDVQHFPPCADQLRAPATAGSVGAAALASRASTEVPGDWSPLVERFFSRRLTFREFEEALLAEALQRSNGNLSAAARMLGLTRPQVAYRFKKRQRRSLESSCR